MDSPDRIVRTPTRSRLRSVGALLRVLAIQALIVVLILEIVGRVTNPLGISYYPESARFLDLAIRSEPIGYSFPPGLEGRFWGSPVTLNALGMRDREIPEARPADEYRVLVLGDSWAFGLGVGDDETIPRRLESQMNETYGGPFTYRSVNLGQISYNTEQELIQLRELGLRFDPQLVLLMFAPNDIETKTWVLDKRRGFVSNYAQRSYAACLLFTLARRVRHAVGSSPALINTSAYEEGNPRWEAIESSMTEIRRICARRQIPFALVTPGLEEDDPALELLRGLGRAEDFPVVNVRPTADPRWADRSIGELQNSAVDSHPNAEGTTVHATLIREALEARGWLPPPAPKGQAGAEGDSTPASRVR